MAALVDTNVLVYRFPPPLPEKQRAATGLLRRGIAEDALRVPHQGIVEFVQAVSRPLRGAPPLLPLGEALREAEELLAEFTVLYPNALLRTALRGSAAYPLPGLDAHLRRGGRAGAGDRPVPGAERGNRVGRRPSCQRNTNVLR